MSQSNYAEKEYVVKCEGITKQYILGEVTVNALRGIDLEIKKGEFVSIMGSSGCGKTTLLNIIGSLDKPTDGRIFIEGQEISNSSDNELTQIRRRKVGFVFQFYNLLPVLSALENVELPMLIAGKPKEERLRRAEDLLKQVDLLSRKNHKPDEMSGGERQRVAIARALSNKPAILLADEPTGDLDTETGESILNLLKTVNKEENQTLVLVTHDKQIAKESNRIFYMKDGLISKIEDR